MAFIETIGEDGATAPIARLFTEHRDQLGYLPNYARLFAHRPAVYEAWQQLKETIAGSMDARRYELVTLAAARELRSSYCALAHGKVLAERFLDPTTVRNIAEDHRAAGLDEVDVAVMDLAAKVAADTTSVTENDIDRLRELGLSDEEIFDVVLAAAARCFFSKAVDGLGVEADAEYDELEPELREALTVGRPIATR
ncbi:MAG: peroxidase-related enzyme [Actinobacteria bacterium]|nr:MAG: peroxidase-related enzyme [Actinomycetota bacterium]